MLEAQSMLFAAVALSCLVLLQRKGKRKAEQRDEERRYSQQKLIVGRLGQEVLKGSSALIIGCGGLASGCVPALAGAGVGCIGVVDYDIVSLSNLHRQTMYNTAQIGKSKVECAKSYIQALNPFVRVHCFPRRVVTLMEMMEVSEMFDVVVDCSDNSDTRYLINESCMELNKPLVTSSAIGTCGQVAVFWLAKFPESGCYNCVFPRPSSKSDIMEKCSTDGVLGPVPLILGAMQALETIKVLLLKANQGDRMATGQFLSCFELSNLADAPLATMKLKRNPNCPHCKSWVKNKSDSLKVAVDVLVIDEDWFVVDVRPSNTVTFPRANLRLPLKTLEENCVMWSDKVYKLAKDRPICFVCQQGITSRMAASIFLRSTDNVDCVFSLQGGINSVFKID